MILSKLILHPVVSLEFAAIMVFVRTASVVVLDL